MKLFSTTILAACALAFSVSAEEVTSPLQEGPLPYPPMTGPIHANPKPSHFDAGPIGEVYVGGVLSGLGMVQSNATATNNDSFLDLSNGQFFLEKNEGLIQFYLQAGGYSIPALGTPYLEAEDTTKDTFGILPEAYIKIAPTDNFSIMAGKLPTLIGAEYTFTFQNMNIQRGLLWNQENAVNRGVQVNYATGPITAAISLNDGFYSEEYNWVSGLVSWAIDDENTLAFAAGGNVDETTRNRFETPLLQNNSSIYNLMYTYHKGPWIISPYLQYTRLEENAAIGIADDAETMGAAFLAEYQFCDKWSLAGRAEYIDSTGGSNLMYGADSDAWSLTLTPTYQEGIFFARAEASYVGAGDTTNGAVFGDTGSDEDQGRLLLETGFLF